MLVFLLFNEINGNWSGFAFTICGHYFCVKLLVVFHVLVIITCFSPLLFTFMVSPFINKDINCCFSFSDQRLNDIVGSAYYVAPEVLHRSYSVEADIWSIGVITYILLCGSRPFWARTESGIFRSVLRADPNFDDTPWPTVSPEAKDFVRRLLNKDHRKRMTAAQALGKFWHLFNISGTAHGALRESVVFCAKN